MLSDADLQYLAGFTGYSRARGYVRNGRVRLIHATKTSCDATVSGLEMYGVTLSRSGTYVLTSCECPQMKGKHLPLRFSEKPNEFARHDESVLDPHADPVFCPHIVAVLLSWQKIAFPPALESGQEADQLHATETSLCKAFQTTIQIQILLYWHEVLEEIRVIPRIVLREQGGKPLGRVHPLASDVDLQMEALLYSLASNALHSENSCKQSCTDLSDQQASTLNLGLGESRDAIQSFFLQWPGWMPDESGFLSLPGKEGALSVLTEVVPLFPGEWSVLLDKKLERMRPKRVVIQSVIQMGEPRNNGLLDFNVRFQCEQLGLSEEALRAFIRGQQLWLIDGGQYVQVDNLAQLWGLLRLLPNDAVADDEDSAAERQELRNAQQAAELLAWMEEQEAGTIRVEGQLQALLRDTGAEDIPFPMPELPEALTRTLRTWQKTGVGWLTLMAKYGFGCVLADDMGLGKTLQVLAFLRGRRGSRPSLLLCPKSLLFNWLQEARRFVPDLRVLLVHGMMADRHRRLRSGLDVDLIITTYPLFLMDWELYRDVRFDCFLLDEAQLIRNPGTRLSKHVRKMKTAVRIAMTGTPLENSPLDLWSILDFVMPGYLGAQTDFRTRCQEGPASLIKLVRRVHPFLLRRTKTEVLPELPARTEVDIPVVLTQNQLALYEHTRTHIRAGITKAMSEKGSGAAWIELLAGLTRLRQICCHPGLVQEAWRTVQGASGKMEVFDTLISQCLEGGHKVLVFSQFASMLVLLQNHLNRKRIACLRLDGQTRDRQSLIDRFNRDEDMLVFLISLKAGGFGLNLTAADTVILFDPWWNPMVEEQAADRAHRFGQTHPVTIYRLIAQGTIESRMQRLKAQKRAMFDAIVNGAAGDRVSLSREELAWMLEAEG